MSGGKGERAGEAEIEMCCDVTARGERLPAFACLLNGSCQLPSGLAAADETASLSLLGPEDAHHLQSQLVGVTGCYSHLTRETDC